MATPPDIHNSTKDERITFVKDQWKCLNHWLSPSSVTTRQSSSKLASALTAPSVAQVAENAIF